DWLNKQLLETELLWTSLTAGSDWLDSMARAARDNNMKIQYCMSQSRHALYSLNWPEVTQARVTDDLSPVSRELEDRCDVTLCSCSGGWLHPKTLSGRQWLNLEIDII
ncbi:hypothetical protein BaRGS_00017119, partial [Batillaria attramentaria]